MRRKEQWLIRQDCGTGFALRRPRRRNPAVNLTSVSDHGGSNPNHVPADDQ